MREEFVRRVLAKRKSKGCAVQGVRDQPSQGTNGFSDSKKVSPCQIGAARLKDKLAASHRRWRRASFNCGSNTRRWARKKLRKIMENRGGENLPCARTFNNIFARNHLITKDASLAVTHIQRFEKEKPNDMWQTDFKGNFALANGVRCHPLNILDDRSRFCLCVEALENETFLAVKPVFERVFSEYGLPFSLLCDNGNPWGTAQSTGYTAFEVWLMELGILTPAWPPSSSADPRETGSALTVLLPTSVWTEIRSWILRMLR